MLAVESKLSLVRRLEIARRIQRIQAKLATRMAESLRDFFVRQASRAVSRWLDAPKAGPPPSDLIPPSEDILLRSLAMSYSETVIIEAGNVAATLVGAKPFSVGDLRLMALLAESGSRITLINEDTRQAVASVLQEGAERGYSPYQIANGVERDGFRGIRDVVEESYTGRAQTIARTEMATAAQAAAHDRYGEGGVREVDVIDGPGCGWVNHNDPDKANGTRRLMADAQRHPISHPNCTRVSLPVV